MFSQLYKSLVRPILEYAAPIWSPYLIKDIIVALEKVQRRRASRLALRQKRGEMSYEHRCSLLKWQTLVKRREFLSLVLCSKIVFGVDDLSFSDFFEFAKSTRRRTKNDYKLYLRSLVCNCYKYSFFIHIVRKWNNLPRFIVHAESLSAFKEGDMGGGGPEHRNTAKKINEHRITARKVDGTPSPQQLLLATI